MEPIVSPTDVNIADIEAAFTDAAFRADLEDMMSGAAETPEKLAELRAFAKELEDHLIASLRDIVDPGDLRMLLCHSYIKMKCEWIVMNNQINYAMMFRGEFLTDLGHRAAVLASYLGPLEPLVGRSTIESIANFLAQPISTELQN